jgi:hypothetical protein
MRHTWRVWSETSSIPNDRSAPRARPPELLAHVVIVELLYRVPVQVQFFRHVFDRRGTAPTPHIEGEAFRVVRVVG